MTICPVALAVGCKKCPVFSVCPLTKVIGDQGKVEESSQAKSHAPKGKKKSGK